MHIPPIKTILTVSMRPVLEWCHAETCLPDYWSGHHLPHVQIPVNHMTTMQDVKEAIRSEIAQGYIMGNCDAARLLSDDMVRPEEEALANAFTRAAYAAINKMRPSKKGTRRVFRDLEPDTGEEWDSVYAYFVLRDQE